MVPITIDLRDRTSIIHTAKRETTRLRTWLATKVSPSLTMYTGAPTSFALRPGNFWLR